jgi:hypothetical protein
LPGALFRLHGVGHEWFLSFLEQLKKTGHNNRFSSLPQAKPASAAPYLHAHRAFRPATRFRA